MGLLGKDLDESQRLELGHFAIDRSAAAIANGDHFFQRHAAILGSTGSGKSYTVSLILERAYARKHANIIVFDMHGEYASLANPPAAKDGTSQNPIASAFKIAGPGDLDRPHDNALFLPY
jgi:DNA helicase HerA-like ATPase